MARTVQLLDGSRELLLCGDSPSEKAEALAHILRGRLGEEAAQLLEELAQEYTGEINRLREELDFLVEQIDKEAYDE